jgi:hypothetical protein
LRRHGERSPRSIDEQTSGFEPDRMQRSEKFSKDLAPHAGFEPTFADATAGGPATLRLTAATPPIHPA